MRSERTKMRLEGLKPLVEAGDAEAQFQSGMLYYPYCEEGEVQLAMGLFEKAAAQGHAKAMRQLGQIYACGKFQGIEGGNNFEKAMELYNKSAELGCAQAYLSLGVMYRVGKGVEKNEKISEEWYNKYLNSDYFADCIKETLEGERSKNMTRDPGLGLVKDVSLYNMSVPIVQMINTDDRRRLWLLSDIISVADSSHAKNCLDVIFTDNSKSTPIFETKELVDKFIAIWAGSYRR